MALFFNPLIYNFKLSGLKRNHTNHRHQETGFVHMLLYNCYNMKTKTTFIAEVVLFQS